MDQEKVLQEIVSLIGEGKEILMTKVSPPPGFIAADTVNAALYAGWYAKSLSFLNLFLSDENEFVHNFQLYRKNTHKNAVSSISILEAVAEYLKKGYITVSDADAIDCEAELRRIFSRFHRVARQLRSRHNGRTTIEIDDEYDVQDLLHALLKLYFDDVRAEEWTPSYAGKSARVDFLLKNEKVVIEVKKTRKGLTDKELGDQLIVDVDRYRVHPDCKKLICYVYDPEARIGNPEGIMNDLNERHKGFVEVIIEPLN